MCCERKVPRFPNTIYYIDKINKRKFVGSVGKMCSNKVCRTFLQYHSWNESSYTQFQMTNHSLKKKGCRSLARKRVDVINIVNIWYVRVHMRQESMNSIAIGKGFNWIVHCYLIHRHRCYRLFVINAVFVYRFVPCKAMYWADAMTSVHCIRRDSCV